MSRTYLVTYDICDQKRWREIFKVMHGFGDHVQYSVFRCELSATNRVKLRNMLADLVNHHEDQVLIVDLGPTDSLSSDTVESVGRAYEPGDQDAFIF